MSTAMAQISQQSSRRELEELFRQHYQLVYRTAYSVTGSHQDAEDVLQTIFLRLLKRQAQTDFKARPERYLYRSAVNESLTIVRKRQRQRLTDDVESLDVAQQEKPNDNEVLEQNLIDAMATLHPRSVEMLILRYEHNYTDAEIGKLLGKSRGTVAVTLFRARTRLRKLLGAKL
jgi:RNA polymerase sigma-70 factor (ECF subfamily)